MQYIIVQRNDPHRKKVLTQWKYHCQKVYTKVFHDVLLAGNSIVKTSAAPIVWFPYNIVDSPSSCLQVG